MPLETGKVCALGANASAYYNNLNSLNASEDRMRKLFSIMNLILCFELIVSPIAPNLSLVSVARAEGCPAGLKMDPTLNRCLTTAETANVMNATASCAQGDVACYRENAQKAFQDKVNAGDAPERKGGGGFMSSVTTISAIAGPVTYASIGMSTSTASCTAGSFYGMVAGALALVIGDNLANLLHKKRLKKIKEDWGKIVNPEQANGDKDKEREASIEAQSESFEMLARSEDSLVKAAKLKQKFFYVATLAYGASTVMALMEKSASLAADTALAAATNASTAANEASAPTCPASVPGATLDKMNIGTDAVNATYRTALEANVTAKAATVATIPDKSASAQALALKVKAATRLTSATAVVTAAQAAVAAHTATAGATCQAATLALSAALAEQQAAKVAYMLANANYCPSTTAFYKAPDAEPTSLYSNYTSGEKRDIRSEIQSWHNLNKSKDMASFVMNLKELDGHSFTFEEQISFQNKFQKIGSFDKSVFEMFKATTISVLTNMNPVPSAHAFEERQDSDLQSQAASNIVGMNSTNNGVNSNAANAYKEDKAKGIDLLSIGLGVGIGYLIAVKTSLGEKLITPTGRAIFSGVMGGLSLLMAQHAGSQAEASEKRAELLRKMKNEFNQAAGAINACRSEDRNDPGKPTCYCYTPGNQRNNNRGNSAVCQKLWAGISLKPTNYLSKTESGKICISNSNKADPTCACKQTKTCMKVGMSGISGLNAGTMSMLGQSLAPLNGIANGSIDAANLNGAALANQAAKMADLVKKIENSKGMEDYKKNKGKLEAKLKSDLARGAASLPSASMLGGSGGSNIPSNPKDAALMLEKELDQPLPASGIAGGDQIMAPSNSPAEEALEFGMTADQLADQEGQIAEVMNQDLDYGGNDINQGPKTNIFDVLSNRYQRSGMRRLFDEKGETKPEKPAESDIAQ
jgi:hypothetical protein